MNALWEVGLSNAVAATVLALIALLTGLIYRRRPALVHGLWFLVLLKLLTPPLVRVPVPVPAAETASATLRGAADPRATPASPEPLSLEDIFRSVELDDEDEDAASVPEGPAPPPNANRAAPTLAGLSMPDPFPWRPTLLAVWIAGSLAWFGLALVRLVRFGRLLRHATPAPASLQAEAARLAAELGLRRCPAVLLLPGRVPPMLWAGLGAPRLLLPAGLLAQLDAAQRVTLLAHELAHLRRRDHLVRLVEFLAVGLYWWHPVVWLAGRSLREAEEQCCDAWVVSALPGAGKTYAAALLETLDFLSPAAPAAPPLASGIGQVSDLKRRLTMIMRGVTPRALRWREGLAVLGLAALLPLLPTWARAEREDAKPPAEEQPAFTFAFTFDDEDQDAEELVNLLRLAKKEDGKDAPEMEKARAELQRMQAELERKLAEIREAGQKLKATADKMRDVESRKAQELGRVAADKAKRVILERFGAGEGRAEGGKGRELKIEEIVIDPANKGEKPRKMVLTGTIEIEITGDGKARIRQIGPGRGFGSGSSAEQPGQFRRSELPERPERPERPTRPTPPRPPAERGGGGAGGGDGRVPPPVPPPGGPPGRVPPLPALPPPPTPGSEPGRGNAADRRIDALERKLEAILRELESMRKDNQGKRGPGN